MIAHTLLRNLDKKQNALNVKFTFIIAVQLKDYIKMCINANFVDKIIRNYIVWNCEVNKFNIREIV